MEEAILTQPTAVLFKKAMSESVAPLIVIVGSGLSKPAGLPDWADLRKTVQQHLESLRRLSSATNNSIADARFRSASTTGDYWEFFQLARELLGPATFNGVIRSVLDDSERSPPRSYKLLMQLAPRGLISLNLDTLAGQVFSECNPKSAIPVHGFEIAKKWQVIGGEKPFIVYLHGHIHDHETWVLSTSALERLKKSEGHRLLLSQVYMNHTVLFVGISADDIALSAPLLRLKGSGFSPTRVFWFTTRNDSASDQWARENDVQKILYTASSNEEHERAIEAFVNDTLKYNSVDIKAIPPDVDSHRVFGRNSNGDLSPRELANLDCEDVRRTLSGILDRELAGLTGDALYDAFDEFCIRYRYPIQTKSFYKDGVAPDNMFFGYRLIFPELGSGNFGEAYQAIDPNEETVCVKIMHSNIVTNREMIGGFRRGVRSMKILTKHNVAGVVPIRESFEMPPSIVMDIAPGNSLQELFAQINEFPWHAKIKIALDVARIVDSCHKLPETILHRDIKLSNIMIKGLDYTTYDYEELLMLDFDMSWHKNSSEKDIVFESRDDFGYLAPEQTDPARVVSTRSTKVDTYGLGMTMFAVFGGYHPMAGWSMSGDWERRVREAAAKGFRSPWRSLKQRTVRMLLDATKIGQEERLDFATFYRRLQKVYPPAADLSNAPPIDLVAEEVLAQLADGREYWWDDVGDEGYVEFQGGVKVEIEVDNNQTFLKICLRYADRGDNSSRTRKPLLGEAKKEMDQICSRVEANVQRANIAHGMLDYIFSVRAGDGLEFCRMLAGELNRPISTLLRIQ